MEPYVSGTAIIQHSETGEEFEISPTDISFDVVETSERNMGPENTYRTDLEHEQLGMLSWTLWEYPIGAENGKETHVGHHRIIRDFDYGLDPMPNFDDVDLNDLNPPSLPSYLASNTEQAASLSESTLVRLVVKWFKHFYEDPANQTPYVSKEGGYIFIYGGPYEADDQIQAYFGDILPDDVVIAAVEEIQADGTFIWAPSNHHPDMIFFREDAEVSSLEEENSFERLREVASRTDTFERLWGDRERTPRYSFTPSRSCSRTFTRISASSRHRS